MHEFQLDLFADRTPDQSPAPSATAPSVAPGELSDAALIAALPDARLADARGLADEVGRRRLRDAVGALVTLCRRFVGFGGEREVPEQIAALQALGEIGGAEAPVAVNQMIVKGVVLGPNLVVAVIAAARLGVKFPPDVALPLLRNPDPFVRAAACACLRASGDVVTALIAMLADPNGDVASAAACALGAMGRVEARQCLKRCLTEKPSVRVIDALAEVADEEAIVFLARLGRKRPDLRDHVLTALDGIEMERAAMAASSLRKAARASGPA